MNRKYFSKTIFGTVALLLLAACTSDELAEQTGNLPDGKYPLQITSVTMEVESDTELWGAKLPQTRVSENADGMSSKFDWDGTEHIGVQLYADGDVATYTLNAGQTLTPDKTLYWKNTNETNVTAWYPIATNVPLDKQKDKLAYVLKGSGEGSYNTSVTLNFTHALAKVRVALQGDQADKVTDVKIRSLTSCTHTQGTVSGSSAAEGWITMKPVTYNNVKYYEANVVPDHTVTEFQVNEKTKGTLNNGGITPKAAKVNTITLMVNKAATEIKGGETVTESGDYIIKGEITQGIILQGDGINLTLDNVNMNATNAIHVTGGSPVIIVKGTNNNFNCSDTPILLDPNADITIKGLADNPQNSKLTIKTSAGAVAGIGSASKSSCGNIIIANVTLDVHGGTGGGYGGAAIGTNGHFGSSCGNITIENSIVYAQGGTGASAIGLSIGSDPKSCGEIKIIHSKIFATTTYDDYYKSYAACIGHGAYAESTPISVGKITITTNETKEVFFGTDRFKALDANGKEVMTGFYKVGKCTNNNYQPKQTWHGVTFNEQSLADGNSNGYQ